MKIQIWNKGYYCLATLLALMVWNLPIAEAQPSAIKGVTRTPTALGTQAPTVISTQAPSILSEPTSTDTPYVAKNPCQLRSGNEEFTIPPNARNISYRRSNEVAVCALQKEAARALCAESLSHVSWVSIDGTIYDSGTLVKNRCDCSGTSSTSSPCALKEGSYEATDSKNAITVSPISVRSLEEKGLGDPCPEEDTGAQRYLCTLRENTEWKIQLKWECEGSCPLRAR